MSKPILIAGAGIGGLTAALALLRQGFQVQVFEQASQLGEVGAGLQLSANATRALHLLGLADDLAAVASEPTGKEIRLWSTGQTWKLFDLGESSVAEYGFPYYTIYRPDLHRMLVNAVLALAPDAIRLASKCESFEQDVASGTVTVRMTDGTVHEGGALIGADGVHSAIRKQLFGDGAATYSGCMAWRGVIPIEKIDPTIVRQVGTNWVGPGRHVIHYPLRGGKLMNFVGIVETDRWVSESWTQRGTHAECHADFEGWHSDVHALVRNIEVPYRWALMARPPLSTWTNSLVALLGDASHPTLPFLAQGAGMAIEDGFILGRSLTEVGDVADALKRFEAARIGRTTKIVEKSTENGRRFHNPELASAAGAAEYVDREWSPERVKERYNWLFEYRVDEVTV
ncbi:FAD-dependent monooxygenase [Variovorax sp. J22R115]|uniref:FAD-dependent monooxygenase n=1 Tax=Variovorax sp. J22R115 TaxID=3053509 RepID=UPI002577272B|nr:FAD-dependent monooxygenase [Variovorax sp. J22R115]MDM0050569.1 FAD-dependent monooxygenase [Variovorax sp. J22R115]